MVKKMLNGKMHVLRLVSLMDMKIHQETLDLRVRRSLKLQIPNPYLIPVFIYTSQYHGNNEICEAFGCL